MRLENSESAQAPVPSPLLTREAKERANRWLARFSPLLDGLDGVGEEECRQRLADLPRLRGDGEAALQSLELQATAGEFGLLDTLRSAIRELDGLERDYRRRLALLAPGDPAGEVSLDHVQAKLAEVAIRDETGHEIRLALGRPPMEQQALVDRIDVYLAGLDRDA